MPYFGTDDYRPRRRVPTTGGRGRMPRGRALGPGGFCYCPKCGLKLEHRLGVPCYELACPSCKAVMKRG